MCNPEPEWGDFASSAGKGRSFAVEMPGGKVEPGETPENAAAREVLEELGIQVTVGAKLGQDAFEFDGQNWLYHWFEAKIISGEPQIMEPGKFDLMKFFSIEQMKSDIGQMSPNLVNLMGSN